MLADSGIWCIIYQMSIIIIEIKKFIRKYPFAVAVVVIGALILLLT